MKKLLLAIAFAGLALFSYSQEICNDGIDNDGDGFVDCFDPDCGGDPACASSFVGNPVPSCQIRPTDPTFSLQTKWVSSGGNMDARQTPAVGDIDGDGIPELVGHNDAVANTLYVFDGQTGALERTITSPAIDVFLDAVALGDVDNDGTGEIFIVTQNTNATPDNRRLMRYEHDGTFTWRTAATIGYTGDDDRWTPALADFNGDGIVEVYIGNQIYNAATGALIVSAGSGSSRGANPGSIREPFPVAADVLPTAFCANCAGLELVAGNEVFSVDIAGGALNVEVTAPAGYGDGITSLADMDLDGDVDGVIGSRNGSNRGEIYIWDLQTSTAMGRYQLDNCTAAGANNTTVGGHPNVADFDADGVLEVGTAGEHIYVVLDYDIGTATLSEAWSRVVFDGSERTGSSVFDFQGDGAFEVVYRDEDTLFVFDGTTGSSLVTLPCISGTRTEYPIVVDVDADGQTDIVCSCGGGGGNFTAWETSLNPWVSARSVWNQHSYFVVNVNDDLTIPAQQQEHHLPFSSGARPLNNYLVQSTILTTDGTPAFPATDDSLRMPNPVTDIVQTACSSASALTTINYHVCNNGDETLPAGTVIAFYNGDPYAVGATFIGTDTLPASLAPDSCSLLTYQVPYQGGPFTMYFQVNDDGTGSIPISTISGNHAECDSTNNLVSVPIADCILPIDLVNFWALPKTKTVKLGWETSSEVNFDRFLVERSLDQEVWTSLAEIPGIGSAGKGAEYQFVDDLPVLYQPMYYRLKQRDQNGNLNLSEVKEVLLGERGGLDLLVAPNPAGAECFVTVDGLDLGEKWTVSLLDTRGRELMAREHHQVGTDAGAQALGLSELDLPAGIYLLRVVARGYTLTERLVVK